MTEGFGLAAFRRLLHGAAFLLLSAVELFIFRTAAVASTAVPAWEQRYRPSLVGSGSQSPLAARELADGTVMVVNSDNAGLTAVRYDHQGSLVSAASFYPPFPVSGWYDRRLAIDPFGGIFLAAPSNFVQYFSGDVWLMKYDGYSGRELWRAPTHYDSTFDYVDTPDQVLVDGAGNAIVVGSSRVGGSAKYVFTLKYDGVTGALDWTATTNLAGDVSTTQALDPAGNVFVSYVDEEAGLPMTLKYGGANGAILWGPVSQSEFAVPHAATVDGNGDLIESSARNFGGAGRFRTVKYSGQTGAVVWGPVDWENPAGSYESIPTDISTDSAGDVIVCGYAVGFPTQAVTLKYAGGSGGLLWGPAFFEGGQSPTSLSIAGNGDAVVSSGYTSQGLETRRYAGPTGELVWAQAEPTASSLDAPIAFVVSNGRILSAGGSGYAEENTLVFERDGATGTIAWGPTSFIGLADGQARINDLAAGPDGNPVMGVNLQATDGTRSAGIIKYDRATGSVLWGPVVFPTTGAGSFFPYQVLVDGANNALVGTASKVVKLSGATGTTLWQSPAIPTPIRIALDSSGNVLAIGSFFSQGTGTDFATTKISGASGAILWGPILFDNAGQEDFAISLGVDAAGDVVVAGRSLNYSGGTASWATLKYSGANGSLLWGPVFLSGGYVNDLALDASGNAVVIGQVNTDMATIKYSEADGSVLWGPELINGTGDYLDAATRLVIGPAGDVFVSGLVSLVYPDWDWATVRYRGSDGVTLWGPVTLSGAGAGLDIPNAIALDPSGNVVVSGKTTNAEQINDATTIKYNGSTGAVLWGPLNYGGFGDAEVNGLSVTAGSIVIAGKGGQTAFTLAYTEGFGIETVPSGVPYTYCGVPYSFAFVAQNGTPSYSWSIVSGSLPTGLSLASDGTLSGTPTDEGVFNFRLRAQDASSGSAQRDFTIPVLPATGFIPIIATGGAACTVTLSVSGVYASYLWLPGGETTAAITVSPTEDTAYGVIITDGTGCSLNGSIIVTATSLIDPACDAPSATSITPNSGPASGGAAVTISGSNFQPGADVSIGGVAAGGVSVTPTQINATTPALSPGTANDVLVTNPDTGHAVLRRGFAADFLDVPQGYLFHDYVVKVLLNGITAGCGGGDYCPSSPVTRAQMAVFLLKSEHGSSYLPPACTGIFSDVPCPSQFADWIEQLFNEGVTAGCGGGNYCPGSSVTRAQMAVFLLKTLLGSSYVPPSCTGFFDDVACPSLFADWIEDLYNRGITGGCSANPLLYCPNNPSTRGQMAAFLVKTFGLQ
jgi:hypothetical protein